MSESGKKWLMWGSLITLPIWIGGTIFFSIYLDTGTNQVLVRISEVMVFVSFIFAVLSGLNLSVIFSIRFHERRWLNQTGKFSLFLLPLFSIFIYILTNNTERSGFCLSNNSHNYYYPFDFIRPDLSLYSQRTC